MNLGKIVKGLAVGAGLVGMAGGCGDDRRSGPGGTGGNGRGNNNTTKVCNDSPFVGKYLWVATCEIGTYDKMGSNCKGNMAGYDFTFNRTTLNYEVLGEQKFHRSFECSDVRERDKEDCAVFQCALERHDDLYLAESIESTDGLLRLKRDLLYQLRDNAFPGKETCDPIMEGQNFMKCP